MKQISGYVLVKESNSGVPNLVVTAYDAEKSLREIIADHAANKNLNLENLGKRIGSILTDQNGKFVIDSENLQFHGNESRPDLLIAIFAPEDIQTIQNPFQLPLEERILYISGVPRADAGAEEAFVIRLLQAQLDHFQIPAIASTRGNEAHIHRLVNSIESTWNYRDSLKNKLQTRLQAEQKKSEEIKHQARDKVKHLSGIPQYLRDDNMSNNQLLINGKKDLAKNLKRKQEKSITDGLALFQTRKPVMRLTLTKGELADLGITVKNGKITGKIDPEKFTKKVGSLIKGFDLVRLRGINNPSPEALEEKYLTEKPATVDVRADHQK